MGDCSSLNLHCGLFVGRKRKWDGGYVHVQEDGRELFIIEKQRGGERFHISTRCHSETAAHKHLVRFEADPAGYAEEMEHGRQDSGRLVITAELIDQFTRWQTSRHRPVTQKYANEIGHRLEDWMEDLAGRDMRRLDLAVLKDAVRERKTCAQHRIIAIKAFCAWLRTERALLDRRDDVTLDLAVPQASPEKHRRRKAVPVESVRVALRHLAPAYRDCLLLLAHVGWHTTELQRFARDADAQIAPGRDDVLAVLQVRHKTGDTTRTPILDRDVLAAAQRIRERRELPRKMNATLKKACLAGEIEPFTFGVMRHTVATLAVEAGTPPELVAEFLGHKSKTTTAKFYVDVAVPTRAIRLPKLT